jgi:hypothetical protein
VQIFVIHIAVRRTVAVGRNHSKMRGSDDENITEEEDDGSPMSSSLADKKRRARKKKPDVPLSDTSSSSDNVVDSSYCEGDSVNSLLIPRLRSYLGER